MDARPFPVRFREYVSERFPPAKTGLLVGAFSSASVTASAILGGRALPGWETYAIAFAVALSALFQLRVLDEYKDAEDDARYRPERPVPRGLVTQRELWEVGWSSVALSIGLLLLLDWRLPLVYLGVLAFMALMTVHFFVPQERPNLLPEDVLIGGKLIPARRPDLPGNSVFTLLSHMLVMPLIDFLVTACEWLPTGEPPPFGLWLFLGLSFVNGCVVEIGRKAWAPENERLGVDTYSARWGHRATGSALIAAGFAAVTLISRLGGHTATPWLYLAGLVIVIPLSIAGIAYHRNPSPANQDRVELMSGLFVFLSYMAAGYLPLLNRYLSGQ